MNLISEPLFQNVLRQTPFSQKELMSLIYTAPHRYKSHWIEKRNGSGHRLISQPSAEIKLLQKIVVKNILSKLPIHDAATAYRSRLSIKDHARPHAESKFLLKLDFQNFFPNLKQKTIDYRLSQDTDFSKTERWILSQILCRESTPGHLELAIGAPSSPILSNYLLFEFDNHVAWLCGEEAIYTRYADDIAISTNQPKLLDQIHQAIRNLLTHMPNLHLTLNESKTVNVSRKKQRRLTGLILSNNGQTSIGRRNKRIIRAKLYCVQQHRLSLENLLKLQGQLAFIHSVDPDFVEQICSRYNFQSFKNLIRNYPQ